MTRTRTATSDTLQISTVSAGLLLTIMLATVGGLVGAIVYTVETHTIAMETKERVSHIQDGLDQLWEKALR